MLPAALNAVQVAVGLVFLLSATTKLLDLRRTMHGVAEYQLLPRPFAAGYGFALVPLEGFVALTLLSGHWVRLGAVVGQFLLGSFFVAVAVNVRRRRYVPCLCFGAASNESISGRSLIRIVMLATGSLAVLLSGQTGVGLLDRMLRSPQEGLVTVTLAAFALVAGMWVLRAQDVLLLRHGQPRPTE